jgi:diaminohydroxyphosphoribosylaminopyrimidine deaminase / 5-amino-6-(5-phosphoribosylamino)uracil reductase
VGVTFALLPGYQDRMATPHSQTDIDKEFMRHALGLAVRGLGVTTPNPSVGCVIVSGEHIVGRGWTQAGGRPHAEAMALVQAGERAIGSTVYVTLEPCAHESPRGLSCSDALITAKVNRVVFAMADPDPRTAGQGRARLAAAGVSVTTRVCEAEATWHLRGYRMRVAKARPWVTLKLAVTMDGFIAQTDATSQWLTGSVARDHVHQLRSQQDAIVVGNGTVRADNPKLGVRLPGLEHRSPVPIILSRSLKSAPPGTHLAENTKTRVVAAPVMADFLTNLGYEGMMHVLVEGGAATAAEFLSADLVDEIHLYRAPVLLGQGRHMSAFLDAQQLASAHGLWYITDQRRLGVDDLTIYHRIRE